MKFLILSLALCLAVSYANACTITTASGTRAPGAGSFCAGQLIFEDNFSFFDQSVWRHESTLAGGGNWEFQWYVNDRFNSYTVGGILHMRPTYTRDTFSDDFLTSGTVRIPANECTDDRDWGCERTGSPTNIINPIRSARVTSLNSFNFRFGTLEIRAKMPAGDWIWPALWLMPRHSVYGPWPNSGEIDLMELRGNRQLYNSANVNVGTEQAGHTMHWGPAWNMNGWEQTHWTRNQQPGWNDNFHRYRMVWTDQFLQFFIDDVEVGIVHAGSGFWNRGGWTGIGNPWDGASNMAPFDQEFYIIMNLAVGGTNYFSDYFDNRNGGKPW